MDGTTARPGLGGVVVGVDGSPSARTAMMWAAAEAVLRGSTLCLVHAADTDRPVPFLSQAEILTSRRAGRELLDRTSEAILGRHPDLAVVKELTGGSAPGSLRRAAALTGTIVVGHRGLGGVTAASKRPLVSTATASAHGGSRSAMVVATPRSASDDPAARVLRRAAVVVSGTRQCSATSSELVRSATRRAASRCAVSDQVASRPTDSPHDSRTDARWSSTSYVLSVHSGVYRPSRYGAAAGWSTGMPARRSARAGRCSRRPTTSSWAPSAARTTASAGLSSRTSSPGSTPGNLSRHGRGTSSSRCRASSVISRVGSGAATPQDVCAWVGRLRPWTARRATPRAARGPDSPRGP